MQTHGVRMLSRPYRVMWAGWETDTQTLQQNGWAISAYHDIQYMGIRLALKHEPCRVYAMSNIVPDVHWEMCQNPYAHGEGFPVFQIVQFGSDIQVQIVETAGAMAFQPIDAQPQMTTRQVKSLEDMNIFQVPLKRTDEIIIEEADMEVIDHLQAIKDLQAPKQAELRQKMLRDVQVQEAEILPHETPEQNMVAQIIQFPKRRVA